MSSSKFTWTTSKFTCNHQSSKFTCWTSKFTCFLNVYMMMMKATGQLLVFYFSCSYSLDDGLKSVDSLLARQFLLHSVWRFAVCTSDICSSNLLCIPMCKNANAVQWTRFKGTFKILVNSHQTYLLWTTSSWRCFHQKQ